MVSPFYVTRTNDWVKLRFPAIQYNNASYGTLHTGYAIFQQLNYVFQQYGDNEDFDISALSAANCNYYSVRFILSGQLYLQSWEIGTAARSILLPINILGVEPSTTDWNFGKPIPAGTDRFENNAHIFFDFAPPKKLNMGLTGANSLAVYFQYMASPLTLDVTATAGNAAADVFYYWHTLEVTGYWKNPQDKTR